VSRTLDPAGAAEGSEAGVNVLRCPPFDPGRVAGVAGKDALAERLARLDPHLGAPERCFGLELKRAWRALASGEHRRDASSAPTDVDNAAVQLRGLLLKPAFEPAVLSYRPRFAGGGMDRAAVLDLACALAGAQVRPAAGPMATRAAPGFPRVVFEPPAEARLWLAKLDAAERAGGHALDWPIYAYAQILLSHPLEGSSARSCPCWPKPPAGCRPSDRGTLSGLGPSLGQKDGGSDIPLLRRHGGPESGSRPNLR